MRSSLFLRPRGAALFAAPLALALLATACGDDETTPTDTPDAGGDTFDADPTPDAGTDTDPGIDAAPDTDPGTDAEADADPDTDPGTDTEEPDPGTPFPDGEYVVGVSLAPVGGLEMFFRVDAEDGELALFAWDGTDLSDELARTEPVLVSDGSFVADFGQAVLPGQFTPTGSAITVEFELMGAFREDGSACGELDGNIVTLRLPLEGSTFGLTTWEERETRTLTSCDERQPIERLDTCPEILAGVTSDFPSGDEPRTFELVLPDGYDAGESYPLLFAFHGFGGTPASLLDVTNLRDFADSDGLILVAPLGLDSANGPLWNITAAPDFNEDVTLFDDLVFCLTSQYSVDVDRIYATGMSYGGLMTGSLISSRSDVLAAAAPFSGGILGGLSADAAALPVLATWGGETDTAYEQNFDTLAASMIDDLLDAGAMVVACDHGDGHVIRGEWWPWAIQFLLDHPRGTADAYEGTLPESFPDFCAFAD